MFRAGRRVLVVWDRERSMEEVRAQPPQSNTLHIIRDDKTRRLTAMASNCCTAKGWLDDPPWSQSYSFVLPFFQTRDKQTFSSLVFISAVVWLGGGGCRGSANDQERSFGFLVKPDLIAHFKTENFFSGLWTSMGSSPPTI